MAFEIPGLSFSLPAGADLSSNQYYPVEADSASDGQGQAELVAASGDDFIGILQNAPESGEAASIMGSGISKALVNEAVLVGQRLMATPSGLGVATSGNFAGAIALEDGAAGDVISVLVTQMGDVA